MHCYSEMYNSEWWKRVQVTVPIGAKLISLILYSDATTCDVLGKTSRHPIFLTLGNIPQKYRNKQYAKSIIGFLPILKAKNQTEQQSDLFRTEIRQTFHKCLDIIFKPIYNQSHIGFNAYIGRKLEWIYIKLSLILADLPEAAAYCLTSKSANAKCPCHHCIVSKQDLSNINLNEKEIIKRTPESMKEALDNGYGANLSVFCLQNSLWKLE